MNYATTKKLHNGDEVIAKDTGESVKVIRAYATTTTPKPLIVIWGIGTISGRGEWLHSEIK